MEAYIIAHNYVRNNQAIAIDLAAECSLARGEQDEEYHCLL